MARGQRGNPDPRCPRCGYDQRGEIERWGTQCPLVGVCTECGLELDWSQILRPELYEPRWCVEFAGRRRSIPLACVRTFFRSLRPFKFWRRMRMAFPVRGRRLAIYVASLFVPFMLAYLAVQLTVAVVVRLQIATHVEAARAQIPGKIAVLQAQIARYEERPSPFFDVREDALEAAAEDLREQISEYRFIQSRAKVFGHSYFSASLEAVFFPTRSKSSAFYLTVRGSSPYPAPDELHWLVWNRRFPVAAAGNSYMSWAVARRSFQRALPWLGFASLGAVTVPALWVLLPVTRRQAKVRWAHIGRGFAYSVAIPILATWLALLLALLDAVQETTNQPRSMIFWVSVPLPWILLIIWWWAVIRCYLQIRHGFVTAFLLALLTALVNDAILFRGFDVSVWKPLFDGRW